jgi:hypothetical protein
MERLDEVARLLSDILERIRESGDNPKQPEESPAPPQAKNPLKSCQAISSPTSGPLTTNWDTVAPFIAIYNFLTHHLTKAPFALAVLAPWGGGKSSFMPLVREYLDPAKERT